MPLISHCVKALAKIKYILYYSAVVAKKKTAGRPRKPGAKRFSFKLDEKTQRVLGRLVKRLDASQTEVVQRAIQAYAPTTERAARFAKPKAEE